MAVSCLEDYVESSVMLQMYNTTRDNFVVTTTAEKKTSYVGHNDRVLSTSIIG